MRAATLKSGEPAPSLPADASSSEPIDLVHLRRFTFGDRGLEKEVLSLFLAQIPETLAALSHAVTEREWKMAAHTLKGSSRAVGAWHMGDLAEIAEKHALIADGEARRQTFANLHDAAAEAQSFVLSAYGASVP